MLRPIDDRLWVVETPLRFLGAQVGRRMTVARLVSEELLVHSPAQLDDRLRLALDALGPVRFVVPASSLHGHLFMEQYRAAYPEAELFAAPGLERRRKDLVFDGRLGDAPDPRWSADLDQVAFRGARLVTEIVFLHRRTRTLIVGDLCWSAGPGLSLPLRAWVWLGTRNRVGPTPAGRLAIRDRAAARASLRRILAWDFDRIVVGHGRIVDSGGYEAFRRAFAWLED